MKRLIIVGSPRVEGRSGALADLLFESCIEECPEDEVYLAPVSTLDVAGCNACDFCKRKAKGAMTEQEAADDQAFEEQRAEDDSDDDLHSVRDIKIAALVGERRAGAKDEAVGVVADAAGKLLHENTS